MWISQDITREMGFLFHSFLLGAEIALAYDGFLIVRRLIRHSGIVVSLEDLAFWIVCALEVFRVLCRENDGMLRWFAVAGAFSGMLVYKKTVSRLIIGTACRVSTFFGRVLMKIGRALAKPAKKILDRGKAGGKVLGSRLSWFLRCLKKKLTLFLKMFKMVLSKK